MGHRSQPYRRERKFLINPPVTFYGVPTAWLTIAITFPSHRTPIRSEYQSRTDPHLYADGPLSTFVWAGNVHATAETTRQYFENISSKLRRTSPE